MKINRKVVRARPTTPVRVEEERKVTDKEDGDKKAAFDRAALSLVNHARAVDLLNNTKRERKYVRNRTYRPANKL